MEVQVYSLQEAREPHQKEMVLVLLANGLLQMLLEPCELCRRRDGVGFPGGIETMFLVGMAGESGLSTTVALLSKHGGLSTLRKLNHGERKEESLESDQPRMNGEGHRLQTSEGQRGR